MTEQGLLMPVVDRSLCTGCGDCVENCPAGAVQIVNGYVEFIPTSACTYCGVCQDVCPEGAVSLYFEVGSIVEPKPTPANTPG